MSTGVTDALLSLKRVSLSFKGVSALNALSLDVRRGEICALIGPNGAGKSSLLNIMNGVYRADAGRVVFDGHTFARIRPLQAARLGIGRTFQHNALFAHMTAIDNVIAGLIRRSRSRSTAAEQALRLGRSRREERDVRDAARRALAFLGIAEFEDRVAGTLPYGIQKRVDLARALVAEPALLLLDEPLAGMGSADKQQMGALIRRINRERGTTIILIEHDMPVVMGLADHVIVLDYGRKVGDGTPAEVQRDPEVIAAYLGTVH